MADTTEATWVTHHTCIHHDAAPDIKVEDLSDRPISTGGTFNPDWVEVAIAGRSVTAVGSLAEHQAFVTAYQAQLDAVKAARDLAAEQAQVEAHEPAEATA